MERLDRILMLVLSGCVACASSANRANRPDAAGMASPMVCDAWFEIGGTFGPSQDDFVFTLVNRSTSDGCRATRVAIVFETAISRDAIRVSTPAGWAATNTPCDSAKWVCGVTWQAANGLRPGLSQTGFGMTSSESRLLKAWVVDVGRRRVSMPIGHVSG